MDRRANLPSSAFSTGSFPGTWRGTLLILHQGVLLFTPAIDKGDVWPLIMACASTNSSGFFSVTVTKCWNDSLERAPCAFPTCVHNKQVPVLWRTKELPGHLCTTVTWAEVSPHTTKTGKQTARSGIPPSYKKPFSSSFLLCLREVEEFLSIKVRFLVCVLF